MSDFTNTSTHAQSLASGKVLAPGDHAPISDDSYDRALVSDGILVPTETKTEKKGSS